MVVLNSLAPIRAGRSGWARLSRWSSFPSGMAWVLDRLILSAGRKELLRWRVSLRGCDRPLERLAGGS